MCNNRLSTIEHIIFAGFSHLKNINVVYEIYIVILYIVILCKNVGLTKYYRYNIFF